MSISAIGGVSGGNQSLINMASYQLYFNGDAPAPPPQNAPAPMVSALMQILVKVTQPGGGGLGQGGGQRGGGGSSYHGDCHGGSADAAQGSDGAGTVDSAAEVQDGLDPQDGAHGLLDAISGLLAAIAPLLGAMGGDGGGSGGGGDLSTNDDAASLAGLLSASGF